MAIVQMQPMQWRAITLRQAQDIGQAAALAGGFVAVEGPGLWRLDADSVEGLRERATWGEEWGGHGADETETLERNFQGGHYDDGDEDIIRDILEARQLLSGLHRIQGGDYAGIGHGYYVLAVPAGHPLGDHGWSIPEGLVREIEPELRRRGLLA